MARTSSATGTRGSRGASGATKTATDTPDVTSAAPPAFTDTADDSANDATDTVDVVAEEDDTATDDTATDDTATQDSAPDWDALLAATTFEDPRTRDSRERRGIEVDPRIQALVQKSLDEDKKGFVPCTDLVTFHKIKRQMQAAGDRLIPKKSVKLTGLQFRTTQRRGGPKSSDSKSDAIDATANVVSANRDSTPTPTE
jgi:hypothetical protein